MAFQLETQKKLSEIQEIRDKITEFQGEGRAKEDLHKQLVCTGTVEPVVKDHPIGHKNVVCQERWSHGSGLSRQVSL